MVLGLNLGDALRLVRSGAYDVVSTQVGLASRDDPFLEGIDLIGVSTNMTLADVAPADLERVRKISQELVLTEWATRCERAYPNCKQAWNGTIGKVRNLTIP